MQAVYIISVTRLPLIITIEIEANLYKLAHTTSMLTANWKAIIFANLRFTIYAYLTLNKEKKKNFSLFSIYNF